MKIYGYSLSWFAICSTPGVGSAISMAGLCKWANKAAEAQEVIRRQFEEIVEDYQSARNRGVAAKYTQEDGMEEMVKIPPTQAFYALTSATSSVLSLALSVQTLAAPYFGLFAIWTLANAVSAYYADAQLRDIDSLGVTDRPQIYPVSFFVNAARYLYYSTLL